MTTSTQQARYQLANRIVELAIEMRMEPGHHLREQQLADLLGVSRTPIRAALSLLETQGVVTAVRNKGFFLAAPAATLNDLALEAPPSVEQDLYGRIVNDRLSHRLEDEVSMAEIARRYGVERSDAQRVFAALERDGLVQRGPARSWQFLPTLEDVATREASYEFRQFIEPQAILAEGFRVDPQAVSRLRLQHIHFLDHPRLDPSMGRALFELDASFHETVAGFSNNPFVLQALQHQNRLRRLMEFATYENRARIREWCREHLQILDLLEKDDRAGASALMGEHLGRAQRASENRPIRAAGMPRGGAGR